MRRLLLLGGGGQSFYTDFATLPPNLAVQNGGTLAVAGGALRAGTLGDWLLNLVSNGEFTSNVDGWTPIRADIVHVDSAIDPGTSSGGADDGALKLTVNNTTGLARAQQQLATLAGRFYSLSTRAYAPSSNTKINAAELSWNSAPAQNRAVSSEDVWETLTVGPLQPVENDWIQLGSHSTGGTIGDVAYFDSVVCYRRNVPALLAGWRSPNHVATLGIVNPATAVIPRGWMLRYTSPLDYIEVRTKPNTAAEDLEIWEVVAGAQVFRGHADVDWTPNAVDELRVVSEGEVVGTEYRKSGAGSWTTGPDWTTSLGLGSPHLGPLIYGAAEPTFSYVRVESR